MEKNKLANDDLELIADIESLPKNYWDFKNEDTHCYTHGIHGYPAIMVAPISRNLINIAKKHQVVNSLLDPFMGSGSVLIEGQVANINKIYGMDLNPLAQLLSKVRTTSLTKKQINYIEKIFLTELKGEFSKYEQNIENLNYFIFNEKKLDISEKKGWGYETKEYLDDYKLVYNDNFVFPDFTNIGFWFTPSVIYSLQIIKNLIKKLSDENIKNFLLITFSETIRKVSNAKNGEFKLVRIKKESILKNKTNVINEFTTILNKNLHKMEEFSKLLNSKGINSNVKIISGDTKLISENGLIANNSVDLVITSPPYGDSHTTVAYGQYSRLSLQWLDLELDENTKVDIKSIDKSLLGGKKYKDKSQWDLLGSKTLTKSLEIIADKDSARANEVFSFYIDLDKCLYGITQKMKLNSYQYWVVGNRTVKGENLKTDIILSEMAYKYGLKNIYTIGRNIINKSMPCVNSPSNIAGDKVSTMTKELIVILKKVEI